jgi:hypothetical protein
MDYGPEIKKSRTGRVKGGGVALRDFKLEPVQFFVHIPFIFPISKTVRLVLRSKYFCPRACMKKPGGTYLPASELKTNEAIADA